MKRILLKIINFAVTAVFLTISFTSLKNANAAGALEPYAGVYSPRLFKTQAMYGDFIFGFGFNGKWLQQLKPEDKKSLFLEYGMSYFYGKHGKPEITRDASGAHFSGIISKADDLTNPSLNINFLILDMDLSYSFFAKSMISPFIGAGLNLLYLREELLGQSTVGAITPPYPMTTTAQTQMSIGPHLKLGITIFPRQNVHFNVAVKYMHLGDKLPLEPFTPIFKSSSNKYGGISTTFGATIFFSTAIGETEEEFADLKIESFGLLRDSSAFNFLITCYGTEYVYFIDSCAAAPPGGTGEPQSQNIVCRPGQTYSINWKSITEILPGTYVGAVTYKYGRIKGYDSFGKPIWTRPPRSGLLKATCIVK